MWALGAVVSIRAATVGGAEVGVLVVLVVGKTAGGLDVGAAGDRSALMVEVSSDCGGVARTGFPRWRWTAPIA
jgi:hypothetical protein